MSEPFKPGEIVRDLSDHLYHARPDVSSSFLKKFMRSPMHSQVPDEDSVAFRFGRLVHGLTLEPEVFFARHVVVDCSNRNTKIYKDADQVAKAKGPGVDVFLQSEVDQATEIAVAVRRDEHAAPFFEGAEFETSIFWREQGHDARARPDIWNRTTGVVADLKTTTNADPKAFDRVVLNFGYHISAEWYRRGIEACGLPFSDWVWIAVEKEAPFAVSVIRPSRAWFDFAQVKIDRALAQLEQCRADNRWPSYADGVYNLPVPAWAGI